MEPGLVERVAEYADVLQIGSRNMQNFPLLRAVGQAQRPVLLKRGFAATIEEWLLAAEYILLEGNPQCHPLRARRAQLRSLHAQPARPRLRAAAGAADASAGAGGPQPRDRARRSGRRRWAWPPSPPAPMACWSRCTRIPTQSLSDAEQAITPAQLATLIAQATAVRAALS